MKGALGIVIGFAIMVAGAAGPGLYVQGAVLGALSAITTIVAVDLYVRRSWP